MIIDGMLQQKSIVGSVKYQRGWPADSPLYVPAFQSLSDCFRFYSGRMFVNVGLCYFNLLCYNLNTTKTIHNFKISTILLLKKISKYLYKSLPKVYKTSSSLDTLQTTHNKYNNVYKLVSILFHADDICVCKNIL